ncbi:contact-dependent growth inhibition system immunity protein [Burkholderia semiarida]|uniref:Contact-dependent growth inhibition system immunity protein n=1 Tax=Burkholderia semiarida TaxID=2843303 RepID=A0ABW7LDH3_9BURK
MTDVVIKRWASAYENRDFVQVETQSGYRGGLPDPLGKRIQLLNPTTDEDLGCAVLDALAASRFLHPNEHREFFDIRGRVVPQYEEWVKSVMAAYGYKTRRALFKDMKSCGIEKLGGVITMRPTHHEKLEAWSGEGITEDSLVQVRAGSDPAEIGMALRLALSRCTG